MVYLTLLTFMPLWAKDYFFFWFLIYAINTRATEFRLFEESGKIGLKDEQGMVLLPPSFEALGWSDGSFSVAGQITGYRLNGKWGLINLKKEYITKPEFESLTFSGADRVVAIKNINGVSLKAGSLKLTGEVTIPFMYDAITLHGLRAVVMNKVGIEYRFGLTDLDGHAVLPVDFNNIYPLSALRFAVQNKQKRIALFSDNGKPITDFFIDSISVFHRSHAIIYSNGRQGVIDATGDVVVSPKYSAIQFRDDGSIHALQPDHWKILDTKNKEIQAIQADELIPFHADFYKISNAGRQGLLDLNMQVVWPLVYDHIDQVKNNLISARKNNRWGLLDIAQKEVIPFSFDTLMWDGTIARARKNELGKDVWWFINVEDNITSSKKYDAIDKLSDQYFEVQKNGYSGLLSRGAIETVHCVYDSIVELKGNYVAVVFKKQYGIISVNENWILPPQQFPIQLVDSNYYIECQQKNNFLKSFKGDIIYFTENRLTPKEDHIIEYLQDGNVKKIGLNGLEIPYDAASPTPNNNLHVFQGEGKFGFRDDRGRLIIPNRYDSVKMFSDQAAAFKLLGKWGYINPDDKIIINPTFDFAGYFRNGFAIVAKNKKFGVVDKKGLPLLSLQYDSIIPLKDKLLCYLAGKTGLASTSGKILVEPRYDYLLMLTNNQILVGLDKKFGIISLDALNVVPVIYSSLQYDETKNLYLAHLESGWITLGLGK